MLVLEPRGCKAMGSEALVALYAPEKLAPYVSLPSTAGGSTGYYSPTVSDGSSTWVETAIPGYTPGDFTQLTTYRDAPTTSVWVDANATPDAESYSTAYSWTGSAPTISPDGATSSEDGSGVTATGSERPKLATESSDSEDGRLSTGAKVGIGVGVAGGVMLLVGLGVCAYSFGRRRNNKQAQQPQYPPQSPQTHMQMQMPPYLPPPNWAPIQPNMDPAAAYGYSSPQSEVSRSVSQGKPSYSQVPSPPPMELAAEGVRGSLYEMEEQGNGSERERGKREGMGMGNAF